MDRSDDEENQSSAPKETDTPGPAPRRRRRWPYALVVCVIVVASIGAIMYANLRPTTHFRQQSIPVIADPTADTGTEETIPKLADGEFNLLLLGIDARGSGDPSRTDSITVIHVNLAKDEYNMLSIPRDSRVNLPGYGETKITHANFLGELNGGLSKGTKDAIQAISNLTGLQINYYAETDYWGLQDMVNALGGIEMDVPFQVTLTHAWYPKDQGMVIASGEHSFNGQMVTEVVHERYSLPDGDFGRQQLQEEALLGIAKAVRRPANFTHIPALVDNVSKYLVTTNLSRADMLSLAFALHSFTPSDLHYYQVPGHSAMMMDPVVRQQLYYWIPDETSLNQIIQAHFEN